MSKSTNFIGHPIYAQLLNFVNKQKIEKISKKNGHERYVKKLDGYTHLVSMLFAVLQRYDSLREITLGLLSEANKLQHLGIKYCVKRSTLSDANSRRDCEFFEQVYSYLYKQYQCDLADSNSQKEWFKRLYILDSTTIRLFSNILKGVGRNPKHGKKKGGIKAHCVIKAEENIPHLIRLTQAATHDHTILKELSLPEGSFIAIDRAYIDYEHFESFTQKGVFYVTKMKKNLVYSAIEDNFDGITSDERTIYDDTILFKKGKISHKSRRIEYWDIEKSKSITLLTNNFELSDTDIIDIYKKRWQIELLFKQLKQNFPLRYFYGDSANAIKIQIWVTFIANLLLTLVKKKISRKISFSCMVTLIRQMLMYYIDIYRFLENPEKEWLKRVAEMKESPPTQPSLF